MKPKNIEDFIPLMIVDTAELDEYKCDLVDELAIGNNHPIYYFSEKLEVSLTLKIDFSLSANQILPSVFQIPVNIVAARFAEHRSVLLKYPPNLLQPKLDVLLRYNVDRQSILNCENTFKMHANKIEEIICKLKSDGFDKISSWMIILPKSPEHNK